MAMKLGALWLLANEDSNESTNCKCRIERVESTDPEYQAVGHVRMDLCPLHAAAPDLLAALKEMVNVAHNSGWGRDGEPSVQADALDQARAAIAKADAS